MITQLRDELIAMAKEDSRILQSLIDSGELGTVEYHPKMKSVHEKNNRRLKEIVKTHGWPGNTLVGKDGAKAAWYLIQHAVSDTEFMNYCLPLLKAAVENNDTESAYFAYLQDRVLVSSGKPQIYGTQHDIDDNGLAFPLPIKDPDNVESMREQVGLEPLVEATSRIQARHNATIANRENSE